MLTPRASHFSHIVRCLRRSDTTDQSPFSGGIVEIVRWYSGPNYRNVSRVYRLTPSSASRLSIIFSGLRAGAH